MARAERVIRVRDLSPSYMGMLVYVNGSEFYRFDMFGVVAKFYLGGLYLAIRGTLMEEKSFSFIVAA